MKKQLPPAGIAAQPAGKKILTLGAVVLRSDRGKQADMQCKNIIVSDPLDLRPISQHVTDSLPP